MTIQNTTGSSSDESKAEEGNLTVDGIWGQATTKRLQEISGTVRDGAVSNQYAVYKNANPGLAAGWDWKEKPSKPGSALIKAVQQMVGVNQDGFIGPVTIKAMQKYWNTVQDGIVSKPSILVKAIQTWANNR